MLEYDSESGVLKKNGVASGTKNKSGYLVTRYQGKLVYVHRLAWFLVHGVWPERLDHINGDRSDNRICNLREISAEGNARNKSVNHRTSYGLPAGAHMHKPSGLIKSSIRVDGRNVHLGYFKTPEDASLAYLEAKKKHHKEWQRHAKE